MVWVQDILACWVRADLCQVMQGASSGAHGAYLIQGHLSTGYLQDSHLEGRQGRLEAEHVTS